MTRDFRYFGTTVEPWINPSLLPICHLAHGFMIAAYLYGHELTEDEVVQAVEHYVGVLTDEDHTAVIHFLADQGYRDTE